MSKKIFEKFTNQYALSKTLRFELKPEGKTLENMREHLGYDKDLQTFLYDQNIETAYQVLKPVFDKLHEEFITKSLENSEAKNISFNEYYGAYKKLRNETDKEKKRKLEKPLVDEEKRLRGLFAGIYKVQGETFKCEVGNNEKGKAILKEKGYKVLTEAGILKYIKKNITKFAELGLKTKTEIQWKKENKNLVEKTDLEKALLGTAEKKAVFDGFFTYLTGFNQNRENYYSMEDKSTAVASRIVSDNLPKFCANALTFSERKDEFLGALLFLKGRNIATVNKDKDELYEIEMDIFEIGNFVNCLSQKEIEEYNKKIGNANFIANLYSQQRNGEPSFKKLPKFKELYKQIGCGKRGEFIQVIKNDEELKNILQDAAERGELFFKNAKKFSDEMSTLDGFEGIYWSDKALNTISGKYFANWEVLKDSLKTAKVFRKEKDEIKIPQTIELLDLFEVLDGDTPVEFKEHFKENDKEKQKILNGSGRNSHKLLKMIFADIEANEKDFENAQEKVLAIHDDYKKDENTHIVKTFMDALLWSNQILKYFKVRENKIKGNPLNAEISEMLDKILFVKNPTEYYDIVRNYLTKKTAVETNKLKLNFENSSIAAGWDLNKQKDNSCVILKDSDGRKYLAIMKYDNTKIFEKTANNLIFIPDDSGLTKMEYKLVPGASKTLPKVLFSAKWLANNPTPAEISKIYKDGTFKKGDVFIKNDLHKLVGFYKEQLKKYPSGIESWQKIFDFMFSDTKTYNGVDEFYNEVDKQGYKIDFVPINKSEVDRLVEGGKVYLFEIYNKDSNLKDGKEKFGNKNLHTIYWNAVFGNLENKPKLNGEAEIFYRPAVTFEKKKDKNGTIIGADHKRFDDEKFIFHCPITLNFCLKSSRMNDKINKEIIRENNEFSCIGIDRGEKHLAYYSEVNQNGEILDQGSLNMEFDKPVKAEKWFEDKTKGENDEKRWTKQIVDCHDYNELLDARASNRDRARKNWQTIGTIKELKEGYISQVVRKIVDLAIYENKKTKELRKSPAFIVLENLNIGFKRGRQKIEKSVYQKLELALAKKLNFVVDKKAKDGELMSVQSALQLTPQVSNFSDIEKASQFGIMFYVRANYTSQTDPISGWRKTIYFKSSKNENLEKEIKDSFNEIGFDSKDYYFDYTDKNTGKKWRLWSGKNGKELKRFRWNNQERKIEQKHITSELENIFGKQETKTDDLKSMISEKNAKNLKFAIELIQQIRNTGIDGKDNDFILSPVRDENGNHFDSRESGVIIANGDANGAYNIARKGFLMSEHIRANADPKDLNLFISDSEWDMYLANKEIWKKQLPAFSSRKAMEKSRK